MRPVRGGGFLVWNPDRGYPSYTHATFQSALAEAERLKRALPGDRFYVMAPVTDEASAGYAMGYTRGKLHAEQQAHMEIMRAEGISDRLSDEVRDLRPLKIFREKAKEWWATVADAQCWFDGFRAGRGPDADHSDLPNRETLRRLNSALQSLIPEAVQDDDIPF